MLYFIPVTAHVSVRMKNDFNGFKIFNMFSLFSHMTSKKPCTHIVVLSYSFTSLTTLSIQHYSIFQVTSFYLPINFRFYTWWEEPVWSKTLLFRWATLLTWCHLCSSLPIAAWPQIIIMTQVLFLVKMMCENFSQSHNIVMSY